MTNVVNIVDYIDRIKTASLDDNYASVVKEFTDTVDASVTFLNNILRDGIITPEAYAKFSVSNTRITELIRRIDEQMILSPQRIAYLKQKSRYRLVSIAIIGCYTASMY